MTLFTRTMNVDDVIYTYNERLWRYLHVQWTLMTLFTRRMNVKDVIYTYNER